MLCDHVNVTSIERNVDILQVLVLFMNAFSLLMYAMLAFIVDNYDIISSIDMNYRPIVIITIVIAVIVLLVLLLMILLLMLLLRY